MDTKEKMSATVKCWCQHAELEAFSPTYMKCPVCETLISTQVPEADISRVIDDEHDYYGQEYWLSHQENDFGFANIRVRSRIDLPERCLYWLRTLLKYKLPPDKTLELGSAHGGFVAMLCWAGFEATGLELSPWVVEFAQDTFHIPILHGPVEDQDIGPESFDAIFLMDVLEHLPDPIGTMRRCIELLKPDGFLMIQTPCYPDGKSYQELISAENEFTKMLIPNEHLYLFSSKSIRLMFESLDLPNIYFEPALFEYDMFFVASPTPLTETHSTEIVNMLAASPSGRMIQALIDLDDEKNELKNKLDESEADRAARYDQIKILAQRLRESEADRTARFEQIQTLTALVKATRAELQTTRAELQTTRTELQTTRAELQAVQAENKELNSYPEVKLRRKIAGVLNSKY